MLMAEFICLLCGIGGEHKLISQSLRDDDSERFQVMKCLNCGHVQLSPVPSEGDQRDFYKQDLQSRKQSGTPDMDLWKRKTLIDTTRHVNWVVEKAPAGASVLDIGSGFGFFVDSLHNEGYFSTGLEVGNERFELAKHNLQGTFIKGTVNKGFVKNNKQKYQIVTLFHVLEHVENPIEFINQCFELVSSDGWFLVEVPNLNDNLLNESIEYRKFYWQRAHISYFDAPRLEMVFLKAGIEDFMIKGVQRYGIRNLISWLDNGKPQLEDPQFIETSPILLDIEEIYRSQRELSLTCDTLILEAKK